jgi:hypothetical protein
MSETRISIRMSRMYLPRNWSVGSALSKLRQIGGGGEFEHPKSPPRYVTAPHIIFCAYCGMSKMRLLSEFCKVLWRWKTYAPLNMPLETEVLLMPRLWNLACCLWRGLLPGQSRSPRGSSLIFWGQQGNNWGYGTSKKGKVALWLGAKGVKANGLCKCT